MTEQTDRELLEMAAKAVGIAVYESTDGTIQNRPVLVFAAGGGMGTMPYEERWNPLAEDAQALRLAVKLAIDVLFDAMPDGDEVCARHAWGSDEVEMSERLEQDPAKATRRAITRAAAAIWESMQ